MMDDFILAGPAFLYAARYFGPKADHGGMLKWLRSQDRERAIVGARNAAWDTTYLSEFARLSSLRESSQRQYVFATADQALWDTASAIVCDREPNDDVPPLADKLALWWPSGGPRMTRGA